DDRGHRERRLGRAHLPVAGVDDLRLLLQHQNHSPADGHDAERLEGRIQDQRSAHGWARSLLAPSESLGPFEVLHDVLGARTTAVAVRRVQTPLPPLAARQNASVAAQAQSGAQSRPPQARPPDDRPHDGRGHGPSPPRRMRKTPAAPTRGPAAVGTMSRPRPKMRKDLSTSARAGLRSASPAASDTPPPTATASRSHSAAAEARPRPRSRPASA